jgi:hypothetical protein
MMFTIQSDAPVTFPNSMRIFDSAVNRTTRSGYVLGPEHRLTPLQALNLFNSTFTLEQSEAFAARVRALDWGGDAWAAAAAPCCEGGGCARRAAARARRAGVACRRPPSAARCRAAGTWCSRRTRRGAAAPPRAAQR